MVTVPTSGASCTTGGGDVVATGAIALTICSTTSVGIQWAAGLSVSRLADPAMCAEHPAQRDESDQCGDEVGNHQNSQLDSAGGIGNEML